MQKGKFLSVLIIVLAAARLHGAETLPSTNGFLKYEQPTNFQGTILSSNRKQTLFKFTRRATRTGDRLEVERDYTYPDGKLAARERVIYQGDNLVSISLEETQTGGSGQVVVKQPADRRRKGELFFEYSKDGRPPSKRIETIRPNLVMNDMLAAFLVDHWDALMRGEEINCRFIVIPRKETVGFKFSYEGQSGKPGHEVVTIKMAPTSPFISALVDPVFFTIEKGGKHHVLEYSGRTTPKLKVGNNWKDLDAVTVFDWNE